MSSHTFSPEHETRTEQSAAIALVLAAVSAVIVFFPAEGRLLAPTHAALDALLGRATFLVPLGLALVGALSFARRARPNITIPRRRLAGLGALAVALLPSQEILGAPAGLVGDWLTAFLIDLLGEPLAAVLLAMVIATGVVLVFGVDVRKLVIAAR